MEEEEEPTKEQANRANGRQTRLHGGEEGGWVVSQLVLTPRERARRRRRRRRRRPRLLRVAAPRWTAIFFDPFAAHTRYADTWLAFRRCVPRIVAWLLPTRTSRGTRAHGSCEIMRDIVQAGIYVLGEKWASSSVGKSRGRVIRTKGRGGRERENRVCVERAARALPRFPVVRGCVGTKRVDGNCVLSSTSGYAECLLRLRRVIG